MSVLYIALPIALMLGGLGLLACLWTIRSGQYDDLESPPLRILTEEKTNSDGESQASETRAKSGPS